MIRTPKGQKNCGLLHVHTDCEFENRIFFFKYPPLIVNACSPKSPKDINPHTPTHTLPKRKEISKKGAHYECMMLMKFLEQLHIFLKVWKYLYVD